MSFCLFVCLADRQVEIQIHVEFVGAQSVDEGLRRIHTGVVKRPHLTNPLLRQSRKAANVVRGDSLDNFG